MLHHKTTIAIAVFTSLVSSSYAIDVKVDSPKQFITQWVSAFNKNDPKFINKDDSQWQVHIRTSTILNRIDGKWKIVLEHSSPINGTERVTRIEEST